MSDSPRVRRRPLLAAGVVAAVFAAVGLLLASQVDKVRTAAARSADT